MKSRILNKLTMAILASMMLAGAATAQDKSKNKDNKDSKGAPPATAPAPVAGMSTLGVTVAEEAIVATGWRVKKLLGTDVFNDAKQKIGKVDDFIVSPDGKLTVAVINVGGFLGMGAHRVAIPVQQFGRVAPTVVLAGATKEALKALPEFKYLQ